MVANDLAASQERERNERRQPGRALAQIEAALTTGKSESAFLDTVISMPGKMRSSFFWYLDGTPTVST